MNETGGMDGIGSEREADSGLMPNAEPIDLGPRYAPGEDVLPLARAVGGGALGAVGALVLDRFWPSVAGRVWLWPALAADAVAGDPGATSAGVAVVIGVGVLAAVVFAYGQFRRFVPARPAVAGLAWATLIWLAVVPALVLRAASWLGPDGPSAVPPSAATLLAPAALVVAESVAMLGAWGAVVGWSNPRRTP